MPDSFDSFDSIEILYNKASSDDRDKFIITALKQIHISGIENIRLLKEDMLKNFKSTNDKIEMIQKACPWRNGECHDLMDMKIDEAISPTGEPKFITKIQAKVYGYILIALSIGIGLGSKALNWTDVIKKAIP